LQYALQTYQDKEILLNENFTSVVFVSQKLTLPLYEVARSSKSPDFAVLMLKVS